MLKRKWVIEVYESPDHKFRWRLRSANGNIVADGSEGYFSRGNANRAAREIKRRAFCAKIVEVIGRVP